MTEREDITFEGQEYQKNGEFLLKQYRFYGSETEGWIVERIENGKHEEVLRLDSGYTLMETKFCGLCSTDINRQFLVFPLPQITGHEVVGFVKDKQTGEKKAFAVEINSSHWARGLSDSCSYCTTVSDPSMNRHCPARITLGIDRLPGGFAPYLLAPVRSLIPIPSSLDFQSASLCEPFAAALRAIEATPPFPGAQVAVLGPRRLGLLIIAALIAFREKSNIPFEVTAIARHQNLLDICQRLGADRLVNNQNGLSQDIKFDIVFDTTGSPSGFELAIKLASKVLHLKSTSGATLCGAAHFTPLVVDELTVQPFSSSRLFFHWPTDQRKVRNVFVTPSVNLTALQSQITDSSIRWHQMNITTAFDKLQSTSEIVSDSEFPRFDVAVVSSLAELDAVIRPFPHLLTGLVRAKGTILLADSQLVADQVESDQTNLIIDAVTRRHLVIQTSRCGDLGEALQTLDDHKHIRNILMETFITHTFPLSDINKALAVAKDSKQSLKVLIKTSDCESGQT